MKQRSLRQRMRKLRTKSRAFSKSSHVFAFGPKKRYDQLTLTVFYPLSACFSLFFLDFFAFFNFFHYIFTSSHARPCFFAAFSRHIHALLGDFSSFKHSLLLIILFFVIPPAFERHFAAFFAFYRAKTDFFLATRAFAAFSGSAGAAAAGFFCCF